MKVDKLEVKQYLYKNILKQIGEMEFDKDIKFYNNADMEYLFYLREKYEINLINKINKLQYKLNDKHDDLSLI